MADQRRGVVNGPMGESSVSPSGCEISEFLTPRAESSSSFPAFQRRRSRGPSNAVWTQFIIVEEKTPDVRNCKHCSFTTKFSHGPTRALNHLKFHHAAAYALVAKSNTDRATAQQNMKQQELERAQAMKNGGGIQLKSKKSIRHKRILRLITRYASHPDVSVHTVQLDEFRTIITELDPTFPIPNAAGVCNIILQLAQQVRTKLTEVLTAQKLICISLDLWSQREFKHSYVGVNAHFISPLSGKIEVALLTCQRAPHPHTSDQILNLLDGVLLARYGISSEQITRLLTEGVANVTKGLGNESMPTYELTATELDKCKMFDNNLKLEHVDSGSDFLGIQNLEAIPKRITCVTYRLCTVCRRGVESAAVRSVVVQFFGFLRQFAHSGVAVEMLVDIQKANNNAQQPLKLMMPTSTKWNSLYITLNRFLSLEGYVRAVCDAVNVAFPENMDSLRRLCDLLRPFYTHTQRMQGNGVTASDVVPSIMDLDTHLLKAIVVNSAISPAATEMRQHLHEQFADDVQFNALNSMPNDPTFAFAAALNPKFAKFLPAGLLDELRRHVVTQLVARIGMSPDSPMHPPTPTPNGEPPQPLTDSVSLDAEFEHLVPIPMSSGGCDAAPWSPQIIVEQNVNEYFAKIPTYRCASDGAIEFWRARQADWPVLADFALEHLLIPASVAAGERSFSISGVLTSQLQSEASSELLDAKCLIAANKILVP